MDRHVANARKVAAYLAGSEAVEWVAYPELDDHPDKALAARLLPKGAGSMIAFGIKGGREAGRIFIERLAVWSHLANVGDAKSLVIHPASTTHQQMDAETMKEAGLSEDLVRLSVGLEGVDDLIADLHQALRAATVRKAG
jgi:O-acetylhomoserine (thiol)-lyase